MPFTTTRLIFFSVFLLATIYLVNVIIARKFKRIEPTPALLYVSTVAMIGVFGEIFADTIYEYVFGIPLWRYNVLPVHHGYTSEYAIVLWGLYGLHLYLLHGSLENVSFVRKRHLALMFAFEALILEAVVELASKVFFGEYVYYYYPDDLWHISTVQNLPLYLLCGCLIVVVIDRFKFSPRFFIILCSWLTAIMVFMH